MKKLRIEQRWIMWLYEEWNRTIVGCESFEKGKGKYVWPFPCGGKVEV